MANEALRARVQRKLHTYIENRIKDHEPEPWRVVGNDSQTGMMQVAPETDSGSDPRGVVEVPQMAYTSPNTGDRIRIKKGRSQPGWYAEGFSYDGTNERTYPDSIHVDNIVARDAADLSFQDDNIGPITLSEIASGAPVDAKYVVTAANGTLTAEVLMPASATVIGTDASREPVARTAGEDYLNPDGLILAAPPELTISSGAITATKSYHAVDTEDNDPSDDVDTISWDGDGASDAFILILFHAADDGRTVVFKHLTGNIYCWNGADITLDEYVKHALCLFDIQSGGCYMWLLDDIGSGGGAASLDDLSDVTITALTQGDILAYTGAAMVDINIAEQRMVGRLTGEDVKGMTAAEVRTLINVEDGATAGGGDGEDFFDFWNL